MKPPQGFDYTNTTSWKAAVHALTLLATVPVEQLELPASFAPDPFKKPYFTRQVKSMGKVSASQSKAPVKGNPGGVLGDMWGSDKLWPYYQQGAEKVAKADEAHGASVVHGDYKLDNMVRGCCRDAHARCSCNMHSSPPCSRCRSSTLPRHVSLVSSTGSCARSAHRSLTSAT